ETRGSGAACRLDGDAQDVAVQLGWRGPCGWRPEGPCGMEPEDAPATGLASGRSDWRGEVQPGWPLAGLAPLARRKERGTGLGSARQQVAGVVPGGHRLAQPRRQDA